MILKTLKDTIRNYLADAGFSDGEYLIDDKQLQFIEVFFLSSDAVKYIIEDVIISDYRDILEIKDYKYGNGNITAIITFF